MIRQRPIFAIALAMLAAACGPTVAPPASVSDPVASVPVPSRAAQKLEAIADRYAQAKSVAAIWTPMLSPERAAIVRTAALAVDAALELARKAVAMHDARAAARATETVERAVRSYEAVGS